MESVLTFSKVSNLHCSSCNKEYNINEIHTISSCCGRPLIVRYDIPQNFSFTDLAERPSTLWRYAELLPVFDKKNIVSLGEGFTPLFKLQRLENKFDLSSLYIKDESNNPTGSFKARGISVAVSKLKELGVESCIIPTAGNAGVALAAYCAAAGIKATVVMPSHTPAVFKDECRLYGAELILVDGLINDCAKKVAELKKDMKVFDISTMKEPYRLEGKKTMGYEIVEQLQGELPDVILYPTGGGTGLIGIWKAFQEMIEMGWIKEKNLPRMIAVQAENCSPIVDTWLGKQINCLNYKAKASIANGLAVPHPFAENMILAVLRMSNGFPVTVKEDEMINALKEIAKEEGLLIAPEGAALWIALQKCIEDGKIQRNEKILLLNTGSGSKYLENI